jgi:hypothetical protein
VAVDLPHLALATVIAGWCAWLCFDAWRSRPGVENLILIAPASLAAVVLYVVVAAGCVRKLPAGEDAGSPRAKIASAVMTKVVGSMTLLTVCVVASPLIGFDLGVFAFLVAMLLLLGERRLLVLLLFPALFCAVAIYCFAAILDTPLPLFFFARDAS